MPASKVALALTKPGGPSVNLFCRMNGMMDPFLKQVASHYHRKGGISDLCFIFPNRRSQVFFTKYLGEEVKAAGVPIVAPRMLTINDFFMRISGTRVSDRVDLLLELYDCYSQLNQKAEPLDDFIFWGDVIVGDFDDVDKYLVEPEKLFKNVLEFKELQDSYSYLTENQRKAIEDFVGHFRRDGRLTVDIDPDNPNVKERFLQIWNILLPMYKLFRSRLEGKGMAYEGMVYRALAERMRGVPAVDTLAPVFGGVSKFIFVGLNALNECEKLVMRRMRDASLAEFCWDYTSPLVKDPKNKSSFFMDSNVRDFPQSFEVDPDGLEVPEFEVVSVPSSVGQAKLIPSLVEDESCAVVLPDESLLIPVLNSIPPRIRDINVTMGYPMSGSAFYAFLTQVTAMQMHLRLKDGKWFFYHVQVWQLFSSSIFRNLFRADEDVKALVKGVRKGRKYYIPQAEVNGSPLLDLLFRPVVTDPKSASAEQTADLCDYLKEVSKGVASALSKDPEMAMELEFAKEVYNSVNKLKGKNLRILPVTFARLLSQLLSPVSVHFKGEPLKGLQIMGPLETRALDFERLVILSCNEGVFPRRNVSSSFIPPELRKGFEMPTYEFQDAVWAYYFYRMVQRAGKVTMVFDSRSEGLKGGEESRYIKQLEYHFGLDLKRSFVKSPVDGRLAVPDIPKTADDVLVLKKTRLSASSLKCYLDCPAKFYYKTVKKLSGKEEVSEDLDAGMLGDIFHKTMQSLYSVPDRFVGKDHLAALLRRRSEVKSLVRRLVLEELSAFEVTGRNLVVEEVIVEYALKTISRDLELLAKAGSEGFRMIGLEREFTKSIGGFDFVGYVDRIDSLRPAEVRIVDYKTGKVEVKDVEIDDSNAEAIVEALFGPDNAKRPKIAFQLFLYDKLCSDRPGIEGSRIVNSIYSPATLFTEPVKEVPLSPVFVALVEERLEALLGELASPEVPFRRTDDDKTCSWCDFRMICGR